MTPGSQSLFTQSLERSAQQHQLQMWKAAETVRAHVAPGEGLESMLDCLGLADAQQPEG